MLAVTAGYGVCLKCGLNIQEGSLGETDFPSVSGYQLAIVTGLGLGFCVYFLISALEPPLVWICASPVHNAMVSVSISPLCLEDLVFLVLSIPSGSYNLPASSQSSLSPEGRGLTKGSC